MKSEVRERSSKVKAAAKAKVPGWDAIAAQTRAAVRDLMVPARAGIRVEEKQHQRGICEEALLFPIDFKKDDVVMKYPAPIGPREARQMIDEMPTPLRTPKDDTFIKLYVRVLRHEVPVRRARVRLADIVPFDPPSVDRVRMFLREQPSVVARLAAGLKSGQHGMTLYRNLAGELVMSDDYCAFVVATDLGLERVNAAILGEAFETAS